MIFRPKVNDSININNIDYFFTEHPSAPKMVYGQTGRRATVYQVKTQDGGLYALKVFTKAWRDPRNALSAVQLHAFSKLPGLQVCDRHVITPEQHQNLIETYPDLEYGILMDWVSGETWQEVMLNGRPLTIEQSREIGLAFLSILKGMEEEGLAHCDLSGPNVLLQYSPIQVSLVDVEDMYGPSLARPEKVGGGSSGYAHKTAPKGLWRADADRFAGAVLLVEMLGWSDERVRRIGYGEQFFDPTEVQQSSERYQVLLSVLRDQWGGEVSDAFARTWFSEQLEECPSFQEWERLLNPPEQVIDPSLTEHEVQMKIEEAEENLGIEKYDEAINLFEEVYQVAPEEVAGAYAKVLMTRGTEREGKQDLEGARKDYQKALEVAPEGGLKDELKLIVDMLESKTSSNKINNEVDEDWILGHIQDIHNPITYQPPDIQPQLILPEPKEKFKNNSAIFPDEGQKKRKIPVWLIVLLVIVGLIALLKLVNQTSSSSSSVQVASNSNSTMILNPLDGWIYSGITVNSGQNLSINYLSGNWSPWPDQYVDANGVPDSDLYSDPSNLVNGCYHGALIAKIDENPPFCVGNIFSSDMQQTGTLYFSINDIQVSDDSGSITVQIIVASE